jgi:hypothetical protein
MTTQVNHNIKTAIEYLDLCSKLKSCGQGFFRGQTKDYPEVIPSIFRKLGLEIDGAEKLAVRLYIRCYRISDWGKVEKAYLQEIEDSYGPPIGGNMFPSFDLEANMTLLGEILSGEFPPSGYGPYADNYERDDFIAPLVDSLIKNLHIHGGALLQHYGVPSRGLDVSYSPLVALWFATHSFNALENGEARYTCQNNPYPVVYAFPSNTDAQNLRLINSHEWDPANERIPFFGTRGFAQEGGMIFGDGREKRDLRHLVSHVIHLAPDIWDSVPAEMPPLACEKLFPSTENDPFYATLLKEKAKPNSEFESVVKYVPKYVY